MMRSTLVLLSLFALSCASSCTKNGSQEVPIDGLQVVSVQLNWKAESEHGGLYQAKADGLFEAAGIDADIRPGGINAPIGPELQLGRVQFAMANADDVVLLRNEGVDIVAVLAAMQNHPRCVIVREDSGIKSLEDLAGTTFQHGPRPFAEFMRSKGLLKEVREVPYQGSIAPLASDSKMILQGYSFSEPLLAEQEGISVRTLMVSELGFNPYSSVLVTTGKVIRDQPELVWRYVAAVRAGWQNYLQDPTAGNKLILAANKQMTAQALDLGMPELISLARPNEMPLDSVGQMSAERWDDLVSQLVKLKLVDGEKVKSEDCYTLEFLQNGE